MLELQQLFEGDAPEDDEAGDDVDKGKGFVEFENTTGSERLDRRDHQNQIRRSDHDRGQAEVFDRKNSGG